MSIFDSIIGEYGEKFGLGNKAGNLLSALLGLITDQSQGGLTGFLDKFRKAGLGNVVDSWVSTGSNTALSGEQVESALGDPTIGKLASQTGINKESTRTALGAMIPSVIDRLTPDGVIPDNSSLLSRVGGYLTGAGTAAGAAASTTYNRVEEKAAPVVQNFRDTEPESGGGSILKWLIPLILLALLLALGWMFCRKGDTPVPANANTNVNVNRVTNVNTNTNVNTTTTTTTTTTERKLTEVVLPDGTKLQAYPGGIEDQLVKFIQSDAYKNGTNDTLKDKWFDFDDLNFDFGKTTLVPESKRQLDNIVAILKAYPDVKIKLGGYTDKKGDDAANKKLSDERAKAVQAALIKDGAKAAQVPEAEGYGEQFAKVDENAGDKEREADRRTSVRLIK